MDTVLIAIHGLRNKPPKYLLTSWWKKSIIEGFETIKLPVPRFKIEMAYWAHYMHPRAQNPRVTDRESPQYLWEPYVPAKKFGPRDPQSFRKKLKGSLHQQILQLIAGPSGFMNINGVSDIILHRMFIELETYYHGTLRDSNGKTCPARELIRGELERLIRKHAKKSICILAHSMGCIVAYDVLMHNVGDIPVHSLITFGAPLGFPVIMKKINQELNRGATADMQIPTPPCLQHRWLNFSDPDDVTCLNYNLRNQYSENSNGVRPFDQIIFNNYEYEGYNNPHKAYGYLCSAEMTQALHHFLTLENASVWQRIKWVFNRPEF